MRLLEILLLVSTLFLIFSNFKFPKNKSWIDYSVLLILPAHLLIEGYRWQMVPVYIGALLGIIALLGWLRINWLRYILLSIGILLVALGGTLAYVLPVFNFPTPTGTFSVGLQSLYLEDTNRKEIITADANDHRKLTIQVWYPSDEAAKKPERYLDEGYKEAFALNKGMPPVIVSHFNRIKTHTQKDLPITEKNQLPVIVMSHGLLWNNELYTSIIEELVSQGYIIFGVEHTYESPLTIYEGEKIYWEQEYFNTTHSNGDFDGFKMLLEPYKASKNPEERLKMLDKMIKLFPGWEESMSTWASDLSFCINTIKQLNNDSQSFLYQKLNIDQIGLIGHSWGGAAVAQAAAQDPNVKAVINMDGAQWGKLIDTSFQTPFLAFYADRDYEAFFTPNFEVYEKTAQGPLFEVMVKNTGHANFGDLGYWSKVHSITETGNLPPKRVSEITNQLILSFFDQYLLSSNQVFSSALPAIQFEELEWITEKSR